MIEKALSAVILAVFACALSQAAEDPVALVNPFIGTKTNSLQDNGNTLPGAVRPFGMLYWSPDPVDGQHYLYERPVTRGFSLTHLNGEGCGIFGDVPILPLLGLPKEIPSVRNSTYQATYKMDGQKAEPGYYAVTLESGIRVRLTANIHSGIAEFTYPAGEQEHTLLIDLSRNLNRVFDAQLAVNGDEVTGSVTGGQFCGMENRYKVYFVLRAEQQPNGSGTWDDLGLYPGKATADGLSSGGYLSFPAKTEKVVLKAGISYVSLENAKLNLDQETKGWDFETERIKAAEAWRQALGAVEVKGGSASDRTVFYTALYHSLIQPSIFNDVNGQYVGFDKKVHHIADGHNLYANYSGWDIYRSQVQLLSMLQPHVASDIAQSLVLAAQQGGGLPKWTAANDESAVMVGDPADPILASIYAFGAKDFDTKAALAAMLHGANDPAAHLRLYRERPDLQVYLDRGYVTRNPGSSEDKSTGDGQASVTLEYTTADFSIAQFAKTLGDDKDAATFMERSANWRKIFDPETRYIRARNWKGDFLPNFTPASADGFVEGNSAQYTWMVPYDMKGVVEAIGGGQAAKDRLDEYFSRYGRWDSATNGFIPYFFISNEPSFENPWVYNWTGHPWRTQAVVRKALKDLFTTDPDGLPGNDDLGATSSWVVFSQMGIYPAIPGIGGFTLNSPTFPEIDIHLADRSLHIRAEGAPEKKYIGSVSLDGKPVENWWIDWNALGKNSELNFKLSADPNYEAGSQPPSFAPAH